MGFGIRLTPVVESDLPILGQIFGEAFDTDPLRFFIFSHGRDLQLSIKNNTARLERGYKTSKRFLKAIEDSTNEIVGFITWSIIENQQDEEEYEYSPPLNVEFNKAVFGALQKRRVETMRGKRYIRERA